MATLARAYRHRLVSGDRREGVGGPLTSRFARLRVSASPRDQHREEEWLIIEWPQQAQEPAQYWFSNLVSTLPRRPMIETVMGHWWI